MTYRIYFDLGLGLTFLGRVHTDVSADVVMTRVGELNSLGGVSNVSVEMLDNDGSN